MLTRLTNKMNELQNYLSTCSSNIYSRNGNSLARLLALPLPASLTAQKSSSQVIVYNFDVQLKYRKRLYNYYLIDMNKFICMNN